MKKKYNYILWDIDDTLIDFKSSENKAIKMCFKPFDVELSDQDIEVYSKINHKYWEMLAQGQIEKKTMLVQRFKDFAQALSLDDIDCVKINQMYQENLGDYAIMNEHAYDICKHFKSHKKQYALTNGTAIAQHKKLKNTGLDQLFDEVFISDEIGYEKPDIRIFQHVFDQIPNFIHEEALMIGDSLSSDMKGANNAGIDCCWFNPKGLKQNSSVLNITYEITSLNDLLNIIY